MHRKIPCFSDPFEAAIFTSLSTFFADKPGKCLALLALSGGADSTAMTAAMAALREPPAHPEGYYVPGFKIQAVHVNHGIRPPESCAKDQNAAAALCKKLDIPITVLKIAPGAVKAHARQYGTGIEGAARHFRYKALGEEALRLEADAIVTAHTADDRLETILMAFLRGSGPAGLGALSGNNAASKNTVPILRPLLSLRRADVLAYLEAQNLDYCSDETNDDEHFLRNRIRHVLIPLLDKQFPHWKEPVLRLGDTQAMTAAFLTKEAEKRFVWDNGTNKTDSALSIAADQFFAEPAILREEALFQVLDKFTANSSDGKNPRRDILRSFAVGFETAADLGQVRLINKNGRITVKKTARQAGMHGFSVLIKRAGAYKLNDITVIAGEQQTDSKLPVFYAGFPLVFRSADKGKILAEDRNGRAAEITNGKLVWKREQVSKNGSISFTILFNGGSFTDGS